MTGKPKSPSKQYSPHWGGPGRGGGRKPAPWRQRLVKIACSDEEYQAILQATPRERARAILEQRNNDPV